MLGFHADADDGTAIELLDGELEDARWFSRDDIRSGVANGAPLLSPPISIAYRLIEQWFDREQPGELAKIVARQPVWRR